MYEGISKPKVVRNVRELKAYIDTLPDTLPVRGLFDNERVKLEIWKSMDGRYPRKYLSIESFED